jgi:hypothetical protein
MWNDLFKYKDGNLYWKNRPDMAKNWNNRFAGAKAGSETGGYINVGINKVLYRLHRIIYEMFHGAIPDKMTIDHINGDTLDNRIENLQCVSLGYNTSKANHMRCQGYKISKRNKVRPYCSYRTRKYFGTACGAYMSYATALL